VCGQLTDWQLHHHSPLAYLQVDSVPQVLHQDMKASNILLNNNLNADLSELGLAELLGDSETHAKQLMWLPLWVMWIQNMP
jgi:serine/threonine protein kinase